jgi:hypothetical protein
MPIDTIALELRKTALECATRITPNNSPSRVRHEFTLWRAQAFYEWLSDSSAVAPEPALPGGAP